MTIGKLHDDGEDGRLKRATHLAALIALWSVVTAFGLSILAIVADEVVGAVASRPLVWALRAALAVWALLSVVLLAGFVLWLVRRIPRWRIRRPAARPVRFRWLLEKWRDARDKMKCWAEKPHVWLPLSVAGIGVAVGAAVQSPILGGWIAMAGVAVGCGIWLAPKIIALRPRDWYRTMKTHVELGALLTILILYTGTAELFAFWLRSPPTEATFLTLAQVNGTLVVAGALLAYQPRAWREDFRSRFTWTLGMAVIVALGLGAAVVGATATPHSRFVLGVSLSPILPVAIVVAMRALDAVLEERNDNLEERERVGSRAATGGDTRKGGQGSLRR